LGFWFEEPIKRGAAHEKKKKKLGYQTFVPDYVVMLLSGGLKVTKGMKALLVTISSHQKQIVLFPQVGSRSLTRRDLSQV
jgi:hypothetical protein